MKNSVSGIISTYVNVFMTVGLFSLSANLLAATSGSNEVLTADVYRCPVWHSNICRAHYRDFTSQRLQITLRETKGGFDTAVALYFAPVNVDDILRNRM